MGYLTFFMEPPSKEDFYAKDAVEIPVSLEKFGLQGGVLSQLDDVISLLTDAGSREIYKCSRHWRIMEISGPNSHGKAVVLLLGPSMKIYKFALIDIKDKTVRESSEMKGDVIWDDAVKNCIIHPTKPKLAFFRGDGRHHQFSSPQAYVALGSIIEFDFETGKEVTLSKDVMNNPISYSSDGTQLSHTAISPRSQLAKSAWHTSEFEKFKDQSLPAIAIVDLNNGTKRTLGYGWSAYGTLDGKDLAVRGFEGLLGFYSRETGKWTEAGAMEMLDYVQPFQFLTRDLVLGSALPLKESEVKFFPWTGSISGRHQKMRLGVFNITNNEAAILRSDLRRHQAISWSSIK